MSILATTIARPQSGTTYDVWDYAYDFTQGLQRIELEDQDVNDAIASGEFTIMCAYKPDTLAATQTLFASWESSTNDRAIWVRFVTSGSYIQVYTSANGTSTAGAHRVAHGMSTGSWYFWTIVVSMSESAQDDKIKIYRNGSDLSATRFTGTHSSIYGIDFTTDGVTCKWGGRDATGQSLDGFAHEFSILDAPLSAAQVSAIYNSGTPLSPRDSHNANVISRVDTSSGTWNGSNYDFDDEIQGAGKAPSYGTINGNLSSTGGIY